MRKVLLVEDDRDLCELMQNVLSFDLPSSVESVTSSVDGLRAMNRGYYDLAIIDVCLPMISGIELAAKAANHNIPTLLFSGHPDAIEQLKELNLPYLIKPFNIEQLISISTQLIASKKEIIFRINESLVQMQAMAKKLSSEIDRSRHILECSSQLIYALPFRP